MIGKMLFEGYQGFGLRQTKYLFHSVLLHNLTDKCTVPAHSAHHADKAHRSRLKKMTTKKRFNDDCFMYDCADI